MTDSIVERVAIAMWARKEQLTPAPNVSWENAEAADQSFMRDIARAAIAAMRKADPFMTAQGARTLNGHTSSAHTQIVQDVYEAMIDAALKD